MSQVINVKSTVAQAEGFAVEVKDSTLLCSRYFPTTAGDEFAGKEVLFDFDSADLEKGAFLTSGYKTGNTTNYISGSVVPPRVATEDVVDPTDQDRQLFERLCRAQGADLNRAEAYQNLLNLKAARLAARTDRARELLAALVLREGKIDFGQARSVTGEEQDHIVCKFYDPTKGADNHYVPKLAWSATNATPYEDICDMINEGVKRGKRYTDLVLGVNAWIKLSRDEQFKSFAGATFHSDGMKLDFGDIDGAQHVATAVFNGLQLNVIVYGGAYKDSEGVLKQFISPDAAIIISEGIGRGLQGGCTLLNPDSIGYGIENSFVGMTGVHMQSIFKDFSNQKLCIREESRPLPTPKHSVNEMDWIYCDTSTSVVGVATSALLAEAAKSIRFDDGNGNVVAGYVCTAGAAVTGMPLPITGTGKTLYASVNGEQGAQLMVAEGKITLPIDSDRDEDGNFIVFAK